MELYVHIPFCRSKCRYCDFASWPGREADMPVYADAVLREAAHEAQSLGGRVCNSFFLGGGTPSVLPPALLDRLLSGLFSFFPLEAGAEATAEANPGTLTPAWLETAVRHGVNRLSLGAQASWPELLALLGRIHRWADVEEAVRMARAAGIRNLSLDLMFGLPGQTAAQWEETLRAALALGTEHLSCYGLIPEEGTPLKAALDEGSLTLPDEDEERAMYDMAIRLLEEAGFRQYEISNFARPGFACRHNIGYWRRVPYLGLGASAASMLRERGRCLRRTNPRGLGEYLAMVDTGAYEKRDTETVSPKDAMFESLMLGLRMTEGVSEADFLAMHGVSLAERSGKTLEALRRQGLLEHADGFWRLTRRGMDVQNSVLVELMDSDQR